MYPVSSTFLHAVQENTRKYYWTGKITIKNGVVYEFGLRISLRGAVIFRVSAADLQM